METKYDVSITAIGNLARTFLENNKSIILIDEGIRPNLADMVVQHTPFDLKEDIKKGDKLTIGSAEFKVISVGEVVNETLREEGHCTLVFNVEGSMPGQIILKGPMNPILQIGGNITFSSK